MAGLRPEAAARELCPTLPKATLEGIFRTMRAASDIILHALLRQTHMRSSMCTPLSPRWRRGGALTGECCSTAYWSPGAITPPTANNDGMVLQQPCGILGTPSTQQRWFSADTRRSH